MEKPYFVMLWNQKCTLLVPMTEENGELAMFLTEEEAFAAGKENHMGKHFGFDVFEAGCGIDE